MKICLFSILVCLSFFAMACDSDGDTDPGACDSASFVTKCSDDGSKVIACKQDRIFNTICSENTACDPVKHICAPVGGIVAECEVGWTDCDGTSKRLYCENGLKKFETCPDTMTCSNGKCQHSSHVQKECDDNEQPVCLDAMTRKYCVNGRYSTEKAKNTSVQCDPKSGTFKQPSIGGACDADMFSEYCYGDEAVIWCDSGKVTKKKCDTYGDGYRCDVFENYYGQNKDAAGCFPSKSDCSAEGETLTECRDQSYYDDSLPEDTFYATTYYVCIQGFNGLHLTEVKTVPCQRHCKDNFECYEEVEE